MTDAGSGSHPPENILQRIAARRRERIAEHGHTGGAAVPGARRVPLVPFCAAPQVICELKRRSPSRGNIDAGLDPVTQAGRYRGQGAAALSVLTEEDHFSGSLSDLMAVKERYPELSVLRKDFLLDEKDIDVSFRAGADAVLLLAGLLSREELEMLHGRAHELGMAALVEVHTMEELEKVSGIRPPLLGVNSRDLTTFAVDRMVPVTLRDEITWQCHTVFESGILAGEDAGFAAAAGYDSVLVGEAVVRRVALVAELLAELQRGRELREAGRAGFWSALYRRRRVRRPLVKICGITHAGDAQLAAELGADALGFVFAPSPRRADEAVVRQTADLPVLKVAVCVTGDDAPLPAEVERLLSEGLIDAVQFHGNEAPVECYPRAFPYYKALRLKAAEEAEKIPAYRSPRVLVDAFSPQAYGGTGRRLDPALVQAAAERAPLWLAGGLGPENIGDIITAYAPELIDASSGLEAEPGRKDPDKLKTYFKEIDHACTLS